jgi:hypothetical protein
VKKNKFKIIEHVNSGMAQQEKKHNFKTVRVLKDQTLGIASYGKVCRAKCDDLLCTHTYD